jgi:hypothetical protein
MTNDSSQGVDHLRPCYASIRRRHVRIVLCASNTTFHRTADDKTRLTANPL